MKKMMKSVLFVLAFVGSSQAYQVTYNFALPSEGGDANLADFYVGAGAAPSVNPLEVSLPSEGAIVGGGASADVAGAQTFDAYASAGAASSPMDGTFGSQNWQNLGLTQNSTYYFGYLVANGTYSLSDSSLDGITTDQSWASSVNGGSGPIVVPEPTSFALIGLGAAALALRRRKIQA